MPPVDGPIVVSGSKRWIAIAMSMSPQPTCVFLNGIGANTGVTPGSAGSFAGAASVLGSTSTALFVVGSVGTRQSGLAPAMAGPASVNASSRGHAIRVI